MAQHTGRRKRRTNLDPLAAEVIERAVNVAGALADTWHTHAGYDDVRGAVLYAFYEALALACGMAAVPLELVEPRIPTLVALRLRLGVTEGWALAEVTPEHFGCVHETLFGYGLDGEGKLVRTTDRRKAGVHFTPRALTQKVVARTLEPLLKLLDEQEAPPARLLELRLCDPSCGAGAFLLEVVRQLGERVLAAGLAADLDEAKRLVAIYCCRGVDKSAMAVYAAKLALRLECRADRMPGDWLDDNLKTGDALVGLDQAQIGAFTWRAGVAGDPLISSAVAYAMRQGALARQGRLTALARMAKSL